MKRKRTNITLSMSMASLLANNYVNFFISYMVSSCLKEVLVHARRFCYNYIADKDFWQSPGFSKILAGSTLCKEVARLFLKLLLHTLARSFSFKYVIAFVISSSFASSK